MKIGFPRRSLDLSIKHIEFEANGVKHFISFLFSHRQGIAGPLVFNSKEAKIIDAYPPLPELMKLLAFIIRNDIQRAIRRSLCNKQSRNQ